MVKTEVLTMQFLAHPNIVKVLGYFQENQGTANHRFCLLILPVGDRHLGTFLEDECIDLHLYPVQETHIHLKWIKKWIHCLASALAYMHSCNVHHCDTKPSNTIHRGEHIFFTDFSSSRRFEAGQSTSTESPLPVQLSYSKRPRLCVTMMAPSLAMAPRPTSFLSASSSWR